MKNLNVLHKTFFIIFICFFSFGSVSFSSSITEKKLKNKVRDAILNYYDNQRLEITNNHGEITIKGDVDTYYDKLRIYEIAAKVKGVNKIKDLLIVNTEPIPDKIIEQNIKDELYLNTAIIEPDRINVAVDNGEVILTGNVSYTKEKLLTESIASWQNGVLGVADNIRVLPTQKAVSDGNLNIELSEILKNHFQLEKDIHLTISNGNITLNGYATSPWAKDNIEKDFSHVIGVKSIQNNLSISENIM